MNTWLELIKVEASYFEAGGTPWHEGEFEEGLDVIRILDETDALWWINPEYPGRSIDLCLHEETGELLCDVVRLKLSPIIIGGATEWHNEPGLLSYELDMNGLSSTFPDWEEELKRLADRIRTETHAKDRTQAIDTIIHFVTVWECKEGRDYEGEYDTEWDMKGVLSLDGGVHVRRYR